MKRHAVDFRTQTLDIVVATLGQSSIHNSTQVTSLIDTWLSSLDDEDLAGITPETLAALLSDGFARVAQRAPVACEIETLRYADGHGGWASALLILNQDMPYLVDSIVMALRKMRVPSRAVLNAVLSVRRGADGSVVQIDPAGSGDAPMESYVLCLLSELVVEPELSALIAGIRMVAADAAAVRRDAAALVEKMSVVAAAAGSGDEGQEVAAFLTWAGSEGFEPFGYAYYRVVPGAAKLIRDMPSRIGVLQDAMHPVYATCLAGIPEDFDTLAARANALSVVKADAVSTLHRDQQLDFIGVREMDANGKILGEHCFVGLFSRAAAAMALAQLPFARGRIRQVLHLAGVRQEGFRAEKFLEILESLPRTEVLEARPEWLATICSTVVALYKQPRAKVFARRDVYGRHLNVLVYLPRERYSASLAARLAQGLRNLSGASDVRVQTLLADGPLARVYLIARAASRTLSLEDDIEQPLLAAVDGWHRAYDDLVDGAEDAALRPALRKLHIDLPAEYIAQTSPQTAYRDLSELLTNRPAARVKVHIETGLYGNANIRLLSVNSAPSLSQILPALQNAGVAVDREQTHAIRHEMAGQEDTRFFVTCLSVDPQSAAKLTQPQIADAARELFEALLNDEIEDGRMNGLTLEAGLRAREVQVMRAYASYWRQSGTRFSLRYMAECLRKQPLQVRTLINNFVLRFDPAATAGQRAAAALALNTLKQDLADINHADTEDILRSIADLMLATLRTSYFQSAQTGDTIIFKFDSSQLGLLPEPRPYREIFVFSRRFEGVHLRGGAVARGGLRWSDRMEDYRTEVLGLVKAQMVKNAVIVPAGAKGGFVCKMMPGDATREQIAREGEAVYRLFIAGLLDITDNRVRGAIVAPVHTVCYDETDPYLVVAADKGTATFSDIANGIAVQRGFWLGDAFASGGSNGYDHKKLGITAKGAWEAVKRHFYEIGHDLHTTPITMVGVGDMSGDVFGNGVLLSRQLKLVAAFDHRHIFIDPTPDVARSFAERQRMFDLPRSSWDDYDKQLISSGGGVWPRSARKIALSPEARMALGTDAVSVTPEQLLHIILLAPVDLFYNGGIGTYIKASSESHEQVKDRANDMVRADGSALRCKVVAEGGNLGATQAGRIEFALHGGRIFTDAIDNSAGVDCSDHEVNVKIWLDTEVNAGTLSEAERNRILNEITVDIEALVLRDNRLQTQLLAREEQAQLDVTVQDGYAGLLARLEEEGVLSRTLEQLPTDAELARRKAEGRGLTAPELAVLIANVKNRYKRLLSEQPLTAQRWARSILTPYFPAALVQTRDALAHPLANAILATVLANEVVNRCGPLMVSDLARSHRVTEAQVVNAWAQAWTTLHLAPVFAALDADALLVPCALSRDVDRRTRGLQKAVIEGVLSVPQEQLHASAGLEELARLFSQPTAALWMAPKAVSDTGAVVAADGHCSAAFIQAYQTIDAMEGMAELMFSALQVPRPDGMDLPAFLQLGMRLRRQAGIDRLGRVLTHTLHAQSQHALRGHASKALRRAQQRLLGHLLQQVEQATGSPPGDAIDVMLNRLGINGGATAPADLDQALLEVWALSEAIPSPAGIA